MERLILEDKYIYEYIKDILNESRIKSEEVSDSLYHHNRSYKKTPIVIRRGLLSLKDSTKLGIEHFTEEQLKLFSDETSHINGIENISLALTNLTDLYRDEDEYDPYSPYKPDILIDRSVVARRSSYNYGNEFLATSPITNDKFRSIDIRLLKLMEEYESKKDEKGIKDLIEKYNYLREIANAIIETKLSLTLREMSKDNLTLDIEKIKNMPVLELKK